MSKGKGVLSRKLGDETVVPLLQDILIALLGLAGVPQSEVRKIVAVDMWRVNRILRHFKNSRRPS